MVRAHAVVDVVGDVPIQGGDLRVSAAIRGALDVDLVPVTAGGVVVVAQPRDLRLGVRDAGNCGVLGRIGLVVLARGSPRRGVDGVARVGAVARPAEVCRHVAAEAPGVVGRADGVVVAEIVAAAPGADAGGVAARAVAAHASLDVEAVGVVGIPSELHAAVDAEARRGYLCDPDGKVVVVGGHYLIPFLALTRSATAMSADARRSSSATCAPSM